MCAAIAELRSSQACNGRLQKALYARRTAASSGGEPEKARSAGLGSPPHLKLARAASKQREAAQDSEKCWLAKKHMAVHGDSSRKHAATSNIKRL